MKYIIDFYKNLDTLNLVIFWGIVLVVILLIVFAIALIKRNKKIKNMISNGKEYEEEPTNNDNLEIPEPIALPIKTESNEEKLDDIVNISEFKEPIKTEKHFMAEEHVLEYDNDLFALSNIKKANENEEELNIYEEPIKEEEMPTGPYQKNVLRQMSLSQTSPIGIVNKQPFKEENLVNAKELQESLFINENENKLFPNEEVKKEKQVEVAMPKTQIKRKPEKYHANNNNNLNQKNSNKINNNNQIKEIKNALEEKNREIKQELKAKEAANTPSYTEKQVGKHAEKIIKKSQEEKNQENIQAISKVTEKTIIETTGENKQITENNYLEEVSRKLSEASPKDEIDRTAYELKQEEDAIISYKELMEKKDQLEMIEEEDAVISIDELFQKKQEKAKLYNLTAEEENDDFINELKNFRNDLL